MPGENPRDAYKSATQTLSRTISGRRDQQERLQKKHREDVAAIRARVGEALSARDAAVKVAAEANAKVDDIEERAGNLWRDLLGYVGSGRIPPRLREIGEAPRAIEASAGVREPKAPRVPDPVALLERARKTLALARRGQLEFPAPRYLVGLMAIIGAASGFAAVIGAQAILHAAGSGDGNKALVLRPVALVCVFLGPFIGLPLASVYLGWRHRMRPRQHHLWLLIGSGVVAVIVAVPLLMP